MDRTVAYHDRSRIRFYQIEHYTKPYDLDEVRKVLDGIPSDAAVSAQSPLVPHLALREIVYQYPLIGEAAYILLLPAESPYPLDTISYARRLADLEASPHWVRSHASEAIIVFQRRK